MRYKRHASQDQVFIIADQHFGHEGIIRHCNRPLSRAEEMDEALVERWNDIVSEKGIVNHLGDFTLAGKAEADEYHGNSLGNHLEKGS